MQEIHRSVASHTPPTWDLAHNPDMCPDRESNQQLFNSQAGAQPTEPHQLQLDIFLKYNLRDFGFSCSHDIY